MDGDDVCGDRSRRGTLVCQVQTLLQTIDTCVSFLQATATSIASRFSETTAEKLLAAWVHDVLLLDAADALPCPTVAREVQLKHLDALRTLIHEKQDPDPLSGVSIRYRQSMPEAMAQLTAEAIAHLEVDVLLPCFRSVVQSKLKEEYLSQEESLKVFLGYCDRESPLPRLSVPSRGGFAL